MKLLAVFFLLGVALANAVPVPSQEITLKELEKLASVVSSLSLEKRNIRDDVIQKMKEMYERFLERVRERIEKGKTIGDDLLSKLRDIRERIKEHTGDLDQRARDLIERFSEKGREAYLRILEKLGISSSEEKRAITFRDLLNKLKEELGYLKDTEKIKSKIEEYFGKGTDFANRLLEKLKDKAGHVKEGIIDYINRLEKEEGERFAKEYFEQIKEYFRERQLDLKEKFAKFGQYIKDKYQNILEKGKDRVENLKKLAREFINDTKVISKDVAEQAKGFFQEYKEELGHLYEEVKEKVRNIVNRN